MSLSKEPPMKNSAHVRYAAIYARVSTEDQGQGFSMPTQIEDCHKQAGQGGGTGPEPSLVSQVAMGMTRYRRAL